jgi:hypothetical protein
VHGVTLNNQYIIIGHGRIVTVQYQATTRDAGEGIDKERQDGLIGHCEQIVRH